MTALIFAMGGAAYAGTLVGANSVDSSSVRNNSLRGSDIRNGTITGKDIQNGAIHSADLGNDSVTTVKVKDDALTGFDINESSLGQVPRAATSELADDATRLGGIPATKYITNKTLIPVRAELRFGQQAEIVTAGAIGLVADCREDVSGMNDQVRLLAATRQPHAFLDGDSNHTGPGNGAAEPYLEPDTAPDSRQVADALTSVPGEPSLEFDIDTAFIAGPNGEWIGIDETMALGLNVYGADCVVLGHVVVLDAL